MCKPIINIADVEVQPRPPAFALTASRAKTRAWITGKESK